MSGNPNQLNSVSGYNPMFSSPASRPVWEQSSYDRWGTFSIKVGGEDISEKRYFDTYITPLLEGGTAEPPEAQQYGKYVYERHISPAIGGGSLPPHISAYLSRIEEIKKSGGYQSKADIVDNYDENDMKRAAARMKLDTVKNDDGTTGFKIGDTDPQVFAFEDKVIIDGISIDVNQAKAMRNLLQWFR